MLLLVSPAKSLDFSSPLPKLKASQPRFLDQSEVLIERLRSLSPQQVGELMSISDALAVLNVGRFAEWSRPFTAKNARPAALAFNGDVYEGLDAPSLSADDLAFAQKHLRILSGLYGVLRPLDLIQAYRLEMGSRLETPVGKGLYSYWGEALTDSLNADMAKAGGEKLLVNLASDEYFKAVKPKKLAAPIVHPVFEDYKNGDYKIISFFAKRARGLMARYAIVNRVEQAEDLKAFDLEGYAFVAKTSDATRWVFRRKGDGA